MDEGMTTYVCLVCGKKKRKPINAQKIPDNSKRKIYCYLINNETNNLDKCKECSRYNECRVDVW